RGPYYDKSGVLRDMFQSHILQVLTLVAMEPPARFGATPVRNEKVKVLEAVHVSDPDAACSQLASGQYAAYPPQPGVHPATRAPTSAAVRLHVNNWRWQGVPFYLRSGKGLAARRSEVVIQFRSVPHLMFAQPDGVTLPGNRLGICIQPDEGIHLSFQTKV